VHPVCIASCPIFHFYFHQGRCALPGICMSVCLLATYDKKLPIGFPWKFLPEMYLWMRNLSLNFGCHPHLHLDVGMFWTNFYHSGMREIQHILLVIQKVVNKFVWNFWKGWDVSLATNQSILVLIRIAIQIQDF